MQRFTSDVVLIFISPFSGILIHVKVKEGVRMIKPYSILLHNGTAELSVLISEGLDFEKRLTLTPMAITAPYRRAFTTPYLSDFWSGYRRVQCEADPVQTLNCRLSRQG